MAGASTETGAADCCRTPLGGVRPRREREPIVDAADRRRVYSQGPGPKLAASVSRTVLSSDDTNRLSSQASAPHDAPLFFGLVVDAEVSFGCSAAGRR